MPEQERNKNEEAEALKKLNEEIEEELLTYNKDEESADHKPSTLRRIFDTIMISALCLFIMFNLFMIVGRYFLHL